MRGRNQLGLKHYLQGSSFLLCSSPKLNMLEVFSYFNSIYNFVDYPLESVLFWSKYNYLIGRYVEIRDDIKQLRLRSSSYALAVVRSRADTFYRSNYKVVNRAVVGM